MQPSAKQSLVKRLLDRIKLTPLHPQWHIYKDNYRSIRKLSGYVHGHVLDIGCGGSEIRKYIDDRCDYIPLDYYQTAVDWYQSRPEVYGDAQALPFSDRSLDTVFLLDVLEHVEGTDRCMAEIHRVLTDTGCVIIQVPFVYPLHDAPRDYFRWSRHGLAALLGRHDMIIIHETYKGTAFETAFMLLNIALCKAVLTWWQQRNPAAILALLLPPVVLANNMLASLLSWLGPAEHLMPWGCRVVARKK